jgi:hypothetical protein
MILRSKQGNERVDVTMPRFRPWWSKSVRVVIVDHLLTTDINLSLLMIDFVEKYQFEAEIGGLVEIVRSLDILGAERRNMKKKMKMKGETMGENMWREVGSNLLRSCTENAIGGSNILHINRICWISKIVGYMV